MMDYLNIFVERYQDLGEATLRHIFITVIAIFLACVVAIPVGIYLAKTKHKWIQSIVFTITNIFQTIPSLAMLAIFIPLLGIGLKPAIIALFLYSLLPILRNTYAAFKSIDEEIIEAAIGMGYGQFQRLFQVELILAVPYIMSGIRLTTVYIINWATLAALIGAGGLGQIIIGGMGTNNKPLIFAAAILAMGLALIAEFLLGRVEALSSRKIHAENKHLMEEN